MALIKKTIKADPREVIVKWTGSGTDTLTLASLVSSGQTVTGTPGVFILGLSTSVDGGGTCIVTRNSEETFHVHDNYEFQTDGIIQAVVNENSGSDIVVTLSTTGTAIIRVKKVQGYSGI
jgi:hypothetical protein